MLRKMTEYNYKYLVRMVAVPLFLSVLVGAMAGCEEPLSPTRDSQDKYLSECDDANIVSITTDLNDKTVSKTSDAIFWYLSKKSRSGEIVKRVLYPGYSANPKLGGVDKDVLEAWAKCILKDELPYALPPIYVVRRIVTTEAKTLVMFEKLDGPKIGVRAIVAAVAQCVAKELAITILTEAIDTRLLEFTSEEIERDPHRSDVMLDLVKSLGRVGGEGAVAKLEEVVEHSHGSLSIVCDVAKEALRRLGERGYGDGL